MQREMLKGHLDMMVLAAVSTGSAHGYALLDEIRRRSGGSFDLPEGTLYPVLHRLEELGLLSSRWVAPESGRRRRVYALTARGVRELSRQEEEWKQFVRSVDALLAASGRG